MIHLTQLLQTHKQDHSPSLNYNHKLTYMVHLILHLSQASTTIKWPLSLGLTLDLLSPKLFHCFHKTHVYSSGPSLKKPLVAPLSLPITRQIPQPH